MTKLGVKAKDKLTGFYGTVTARCEYLYDNPSVLLEGREAGGKPVQIWIQESRIEVVE